MKIIRAVKTEASPNVVLIMSDGSEVALLASPPIVLAKGWTGDPFGPGRAVVVYPDEDTEQVFRGMTDDPILVELTRRGVLADDGAVLAIPTREEAERAASGYKWEEGELKKM